MRPGFNMGVDPVNYEKSQSIVDETLAFAAQFGATDLIIQSYLDGAIPGEEKCVESVADNGILAGFPLDV